MIRFGVETHSLTVVGYATMPVFVETSKKKKMIKIRAFLPAELSYGRLIL